MAPRLRVALLAITALVLVAGVVVGMVGAKMPQAAVIVMAATAVRFSRRRRSMRGLPFRLGDVGDRWRALLFGAPPSFL